MFSKQLKSCYSLPQQNSSVPVCGLKIKFRCLHISFMLFFGLTVVSGEKRYFPTFFPTPCSLHFSALGCYFSITLGFNPLLWPQKFLSIFMLFRSICWSPYICGFFKNEFRIKNQSAALNNGLFIAQSFVIVETLRQLSKRVRKGSWCNDEWKAGGKIAYTTWIQ